MALKCIKTHGKLLHSSLAFLEVGGFLKKLPVRNPKGFVPTSSSFCQGISVEVRLVQPWSLLDHATKLHFFMAFQQTWSNCPWIYPVSLAFSQAGRSYKTALTDQSAAETAKHFRRSWRVGLICDSNVPNCHQNKINYIFSLLDTTSNKAPNISLPVAWWGFLSKGKQSFPQQKGQRLVLRTYKVENPTAPTKTLTASTVFFVNDQLIPNWCYFFSFLPTTRRAANKFGEVYGVLIWYWIGERKKLVLSWCFHDFSMNFHNFMIFPWLFKTPPKEMSIPTWPSPKERFDTVVRKTTHQLDMFMSRSLEVKDSRITWEKSP